ncbi:MAG TPA: hypothetical protein VJ937_03285 [Salinivirga sp.]|uniref:dipeptidyl-peptidase 3 family protein n=1 Tax=Salinivirga sp. TaxID=1970192 RepID=UPI002B4A40BD|nr:Zn-dependent hydrolase [Salinivirga sp.]HKK58475.1 hypothetical protein [Salinivirga sp.]
MIRKIFIFTLAGAFLFAACNKSAKEADEDKQGKSEMQQKVEQYAVVSLKTDISHLSDNQKEMLKILFDVADVMEGLFWQDAFGDKEALMENIDDKWTKLYAEINYGPWDRLDGDNPFISGYGEKPAGANYYPADITKEEFEEWDNENKDSWYSMVRRDDEGNLINIPYHEYYPEEVDKAASLLKEAATYAESEGFKKYLNLRADALLTDKYLASDLAWMDMQDNMIDFVVGPIESYEDQFMGYRAAHSGQILIKDMEWSKKLNKYGKLLPELQKSLPCDEKYKQEEARAHADMNVYDVIYYAGDCNAASKNIAINLPNDPRVHAEKGSRKLQLRNAMQAKFEKILVPISEVLIAEDQRKHVKFDAFFENTMFHEVAHGLGINNTVNDKGTVREALQDNYSAIEEGKADIIGLFLVTKLNEMGEFEDKDLMDNYVTFMASIFRSIRFGVTSAHGVANMVRFNYFKEAEAFTRNEENGTYRVNFEKMQKAMNDLGGLILEMQGEGDYEGAQMLIEENGGIGAMLQNDLDRITEAGIPVDIRFNQGPKVLGL